MTAEDCVDSCVAERIRSLPELNLAQVFCLKGEQFAAISEIGACF